MSEMLQSWCVKCNINRIGGVMVSVRASSSTVDRGFESRLGQSKDYKIGICCLSTNPAALRTKCKGSESGCCVRVGQPV